MRDRIARIVDRIWYGRSRAVWLLLPLSWIYRALFAIDRGWRSRHRPPRTRLPVIVVGNITVGGTGKTPLVIWLAEQLRARGYSPGVVSRGYGGARGRRAPRRIEAGAMAGQVGDEPLLIARRTGCPVVVGRDRMAAVDLLARDARVDLVLSDDGLQHHSLARDCEIAVVDGARGLGNGWCLPAGPLREPPRRLERVDVVVLNGEGFAWTGAVRGTLRATTVERLDRSEIRDLAAFRGRQVHAFAGIGNPHRFFELLSAHGLGVTPHVKADHAPISARELRAVSGSTVMVTEKDAVKLGSDVAQDIWSVSVEYVFDTQAREQLIGTVLAKLRSAAV